MSKNDILFQMFPTTGRGAEALARKHGYKDLTSLAQSLPPNAQVLDVGAGVSSLGKEVALLRPDIHWINLDYGYYDKRILDEAKKGAPRNLKLVAGDVTRLEEFVKPNSIDVVFSYFLFPHLSTYDEQTALTAAKQVYATLKLGGISIIGPHLRPWFHPLGKEGKSWRFTKNLQLTAEDYSREVLRQTLLSGFSRYVRRTFNAAVFEVLGTSRWLKGGSLISQQVYNPNTGTYVSVYSPEAILLVGRVLFGVVAKMAKAKR